MIVAAMIAYYILAIGFLTLVGFLACRKNIREMRLAADQAINSLHTGTPATDNAHFDTNPLVVAMQNGSEMHAKQLSSFPTIAKEEATETNAE